MSEILCQAQPKIIKVLSKMIIIKSRYGSQEAINKLGGIKRQKSVPQNGSLDWRKLIAARTASTFRPQLHDVTTQYTYAPCPLVCFPARAVLIFKEA